MDQSTIVVRKDEIGDAHICIEVLLFSALAARKSIITFLLPLLDILIQCLLNLIDHVPFEGKSR